MRYLNTIKYSPLAALLLALLLIQGCRREQFMTRIIGGPSFSVNETVAENTKGETVKKYTPVALESGTVTSGGDTVRMVVTEELGAGASPFTKGNALSPLDRGISIGLTAYGNSTASWALYSSPGVIRTDCDYTRPKASGKWVPSVRLLWPGRDSIRFFAYAPFTDGNGDDVDDMVSLNMTSGAPVLNFTVPADINDQIDLLTNVEESTRPYDGDPSYTEIDIPLTLSHALTAIHFAVPAGMKIDSIIISGVHDSGDCGMGHDAAWSNLEGSAEYTVANPVLVSSGSLKETSQSFYLMPQTLPGSARIRARVSDAYNPTDFFVVVADVSGYIWNPGSRVVYLISDRDVIYELEVIDSDSGAHYPDTLSMTGEASLSEYLGQMKVVSRRTALNGSMTGEQWVLEYKSGDNWSTDWSAAPAWLKLRKGSAASYSGNGDGDGTASDFYDERTLFLAANNQFEWPPAVTVTQYFDNSLIADLRNAEAVGTESAPRDLSLYNIYGQPNGAYSAGTQDVPGVDATGPHTSNCYVVNAPGWYCLPLVYGNAIDATRGATGYTNSNAYGSTLTEDWFFDSKGENRITGPYILPAGANLSDYDAVVVWQDVATGYEVIKDASISVVQSPSGSGLSSCPYIKFEVPRGGNFISIPAMSGGGGWPKGGGILPCNVLIALRDKTKVDPFDDTKPLILWSWHIWITPTPNEYVRGGKNDDFAIRTLAYKRLGNDDGNPEMLTNPASTATKKILNCYLGWTPPLYFFAGSDIAGRSLDMQFRQISTGYTVPFTVVQRDRVAEHGDGGSIFSPTFYQWGRKDPLLPMKAISDGQDGKNGGNRFYTSEAGYVIVRDDEKLPMIGTVGGNPGGEESALPYMFYPNRHYRFGKNILPGSDDTNPYSAGAANRVGAKLWNILQDSHTFIKYHLLGNSSLLSSYVYYSNVDMVVKTICDPCPPGFSVPINQLYTGIINWIGHHNDFVNNGGGWQFNDNIPYQNYSYFDENDETFYCTTEISEDGVKDLKFPVVGWRSNNDGYPNYLRGGTYSGLWTSYMQWLFTFATRPQYYITYFYNYISRGCAIRPMVEDIVSSTVGAGVTTGGQGVQVTGIDDDWY